jgi:membrane protein DedA with SNARE-associated domain
MIYLIVAVVLLLESSAVPVANNTLLIFTGALASFGHINIWALAVAAIMGSIAGACLAYSIGAYGGRQVMLRVAALFSVDAQKVKMAENWFRTSGIWMIFFSRMTPFVRPFACFPAGISRIAFLRFFFAASAGSLIWCVAMLSIGWSLGSRWKLAISLIQHYTVPTFSVIVVLLVLYGLGMYAIKGYLNRLKSNMHTHGHSTEEHPGEGLLEV